jgi:ABC-2 type transport system ATP-binding protein
VPATTGSGDHVEIRADKVVEVLAALTTWALREGVELRGLTVERLTLEDVYLRLTGYRSTDGTTPMDR